MIRIASTGVNPASRRSSKFRWSPKPGSAPPIPVGSTPAASSPPASWKAFSKAWAFRKTAGM